MGQILPPPRDRARRRRSPRTPFALAAARRHTLTTVRHDRLLVAAIAERRSDERFLARGTRRGRRTLRCTLRPSGPNPATPAPRRREGCEVAVMEASAAFDLRRCDALTLTWALLDSPATTSIPRTMRILHASAGAFEGAFALAALLFLEHGRRVRATPRTELDDEGALVVRYASTSMRGHVTRTWSLLLGQDFRLVRARGRVVESPLVGRPRTSPTPRGRLDACNAALI